MTERQPDERLDAILAMLESIASLDFSERLTISSKVDSIDAVASGLNMLSEELESSVVERSKLEEINNNLERFAYIAAHDMKSPLAISTIFTSLLEHELKDYHNKQVAVHLDTLKETNIRMSRLINGVLEYSRIGFAAMQVQEIDLGKLCSDIAAPYALSNQVVINIGEKMPVVMHYETALTQIIGNLLSNAVRHNDKETCQVKIQCDDKAECYELSIADNGPGIAEEKKEEIFDLFENLNTKRVDSTGIGLATVRKL